MNKQTLALLQKSESAERIFKISLRMCSKVAGVFFSPTLGMVGIDLICISARFELPERLHSADVWNIPNPHPDIPEARILPGDYPGKFREIIPEIER